MFSEFKRQSIPMLEYKPQNSWDWLAIMQHFGLPTRLLDWTLNPLAALWFAVRKPPAKDKNGKEKPGIVWLFLPGKKNFVSSAQTISPFKTNGTLVFQPNHITRRIVAQTGWFTVHKYMENEGRFLPLEKNAKYMLFLTKIIIPPNLFSDLRNDLSRFGINSSTMFPDLEGLSKHIEWSNSYLEDESPDDAIQKAQTGLPLSPIEK